MKQRFLRAAFIRLLMVLSSIVIVLIMTEILMQIYYRNWGSDEEKVMYVYSSKEINRLNLHFIPMPFVGYVPSPYIQGHNRLGYRGPEIEIPKPDGVFRIAATGGSTTYGDGLFMEESWPRQLERILREEYGYTHVEVINTAAVGYTSWNTLTNFSFRVLELEPDMVLVYDSVNDLLFRLRPPECYFQESPTLGLNNGIWKEDFELSRSAFYRYFAIRFGWMENPLVLTNWITPLEDYYPCDADPVSEEEALAANPPVYFERNLRSLVGVAQAHDVQVVFSSWAYYPEDTNLISEAWQTALQEQNAVIERVAEETDSPYYDLMGNFPVDLALWQSDGIHQNPQGAEQQARLYAEFLVENNLIPPPGE